jgi:hypothetical protein
VTPPAVASTAPAPTDPPELALAVLARPKPPAPETPPPATPVPTPVPTPAQAFAVVRLPPIAAPPPAVAHVQFAKPTSFSQIGAGYAGSGAGSAGPYVAPTAPPVGSFAQQYSCYGARKENDCRTCDDVTAAYMIAGWDPRGKDFAQCRPPAGGSAGSSGSGSSAAVFSSCYGAKTDGKRPVDDCYTCADVLSAYARNGWDAKGGAAFEQCKGQQVPALRSCYGARAEATCYTCEDVKAAWRARGWDPSWQDFAQCAQAPQQAPKPCPEACTVYRPPGSGAVQRCGKYISGFGWCGDGAEWMRAARSKGDVIDCTGCGY